jgi:hypothetical protein
VRSLSEILKGRAENEVREGCTWESYDGRVFLHIEVVLCEAIQVKN